MSDITTSAPSADSASQTTSDVSTPKGSQDTSLSSTDATQSATAKAAESVAAAKKRYKVKIDKDELEVDEDELVRGYQLRKASDKRFQEASAKQKEIEEVISILKTNPRKALSHPEIGVDVRKLAEEILAEQLEEELMDPKDKEVRALRRQYEEAQAKLKEREEADRKTQEEATIAGYAEQYQKDISEAIKSSGLPTNAGITNRVRDYMLMALDNGYEVTAADVMPYVKEDYINDIKALFSSGDAQVIADLLGEDGMKKVRGYDLGRLKTKGKVPTEQPPEMETLKPKKPKSSDAYFEELHKKFKD